jgi:hypothetical protein
MMPDYVSPFRRTPRWPCHHCGRIHDRYVDCMRDALTTFRECMGLPSDRADEQEALALVRYLIQYRR